jgi:hypothetical protein
MDIRFTSQQEARIMRKTVFAFMAVAVSSLSAMADDFYMPQVTDEAVVKACGECHLTFHPSVLPAASWRKVLATLADHYGENATIDAAIRDKVTAYFIANADGEGDAADPPMRFTESGWFLKEHSEGDIEGMIRANNVRTWTDCIACHRNAEAGIWD